MEYQDQLIHNRAKQTFLRRGYTYTRKGYDIKVDTAEKFARKCNVLGFPETKMVEMLVEAFINSSGWGKSVKSAPFEPSVKAHIQESVDRISGDVFPWQD